LFTFCSTHTNAPTSQFFDAAKMHGYYVNWVYDYSQEFNFVFTKSFSLG